MAVEHNKLEAEVLKDALRGAIASLQEAARVKRVGLTILKAGTESEIDAAFTTLVELHADGLVVAGDPFLLSRREQLVALGIASWHSDDLSLA